jgi:hypothetical protein
LFSIISREFVEAEISIPVGDTNAYKIINKLHEQVDILQTKYLTKNIKLKIRGHKEEIDKILSSLKNGTKIYSERSEESH